MARLSLPVSGPLPPAARISNSSTISQKTISRLSRSGLLSLVLDWLEPSNQAFCAPRLGHDEQDGDDLFPPAESLRELRQAYLDMQARKGSKREVIDRVFEGDWRQGLTLYQLAMADMRYLGEHPTSQKWAAYRIRALKTPTDPNDENERPGVDSESLNVPRFHPSTFLAKLQLHVLPDVKAHYYFDRPAGLPMLIIRIFLIDSPYTTGLAIDGNEAGASGDIDTVRTLYIAFPDASPFVYLSNPQTVGVSGGSGAKAFRNLVVGGIPKALSQPRKRFTLESTNTTTKNLTALLSSKGAGRTVGANGGWAQYADKKRKESPLDAMLPTPPFSEEEEDDTSDHLQADKLHQNALGKRKDYSDDDGMEQFRKRARMDAQARFGRSAQPDDGKGMERFDITIEDVFSGPAGLDDEEEEEESWTPGVKLTFRGPHVFAGLRQLVEHGIVDGTRMPGWLTGEEGVTVGAVRHGRIRGYRGSGL